jgi:hypothetical protein
MISPVVAQIAIALDAKWNTSRRKRKRAAVELRQ